MAEEDWREVDAVLVDEASMLDLPLAAALLEALPSRCQLVFVGQPLACVTSCAIEVHHQPSGCALLCHGHVHGNPILQLCLACCKFLFVQLPNDDPILCQR